MDEAERRQVGMMEHFQTQRGPGSFVASPGVYVFWYLGQLVDPDDVVFSDWHARIDDDPAHVSGRVFLATNALLYDIAFEGTRSDNMIGSPDAPYGRITVAERRKTDVQAVTWTAQRLDPDALKARIEAGDITISFRDAEPLPLPFDLKYVSAITYFNGLSDAVFASQ